MRGVGNGSDFATVDISGPVIGHGSWMGETSVSMKSARVVSGGRRLVVALVWILSASHGCQRVRLKNTVVGAIRR